MIVCCDRITAGVSLQASAVVPARYFAGNTYNIEFSNLSHCKIKLDYIIGVFNIQHGDGWFAGSPIKGP